MKEDILEQIVDDYLKLKGYFTMANVKFLPSKDDPQYSSKQDSVSSDIDIVGLNPKLEGEQKVVAVSCKSWQEGFSPGWELDMIRKKKIVGGRERWKSYRELTNDKWAKAFRKKIFEITGRDQFSYWTACVYVPKEQRRFIPDWVENEEFKKRLTPHLSIKMLRDMLQEIHSVMRTTPAGSEVGRLIQVIKAANIKLEWAG